MRLTRAAGLAGAVVVTAGLGVSAASALVGGPDVIEPHSPVPVPGSARIDQTAPDPDGGLPWAVRTYTSVTGGACAEPGRSDGGRFGRVDPGGQFRELAVDQGGACADLATDPVLLAINHFPDAADRPARTVLFGQAGSDVAEVRVTPAGEAERVLVTGAAGGFLLALDGTHPPTDLPLQITLKNGNQLTYDWK